MASRRKAPAYKHLSKRRHPTTGLQAAFRLQEEQDLLEMEQVNPIQFPPPEGPSNVHDQGIEDNFHQNMAHLNDGHGYENNEPPDPNEDAWYDEVAANFQLSEEQQRILNELNSAHYQSRRLELEERWAAAVQSMVDPYIVSRTITCDWGDEIQWNKDHKLQCQCQAATREVTLVDIQST